MIQDTQVQVPFSLVRVPNQQLQTIAHDTLNPGMGVLSRVAYFESQLVGIIACIHFFKLQEVFVCILSGLFSSTTPSYPFHQRPLRSWMPTSSCGVSRCTSDDAGASAKKRRENPLVTWLLWVFPGKLGTYQNHGTENNIWKTLASQ